jgi:hypothetical protein
MTLRSCVSRLALTAALAATRLLPAQAPPAAPPAAPPEAGSTVVQNTSGHYMEWAVVAIGVGIAVFAVCRSSRRN